MSSWKKQDEVEHVRCDLCDRDRTELYHRTRSLYGKKTFNVVRCTGCGLIYVNPRPAGKEWYVKYHSSALALAVCPQDTFEHASIEKKVLLAKIRLKHIRELLPCGSILDFGCGEGSFVFTALSEGWDAVGIELNEGLVKAANRFWRGYRLCEGWKSTRMEVGGKVAEAARLHRKTDRLFAVSPEALAEEYAGSFDLVNSSQVMEHLVSPSKTVASLARLLKRDGWFIADVPNVRCWKEVMKRGSTLNPTAHLYYFDRSTLQRLLEEHGLAVVSTSTRITFFGLWMKLLVPVGLGKAIPHLCRAMGFLPDPGLGTNLVVVARKAGQ